MQSMTLQRQLWKASRQTKFAMKKVLLQIEQTEVKNPQHQRCWGKKTPIEWEQEAPRLGRTSGKQIAYS